MEILNKLFNLVESSTDNEKTMDDNLELWKYFYNNRDTIIRQNISDEKLFTIIKFLLENEKGKIFDYFASNLLETLDHNQKYLCFQIRNTYKNTENDIEILFDNLKYHDDLSKYLETIKVENDLGSVIRYQSQELELDTIDALIVKVHDKFFELNPTITKKTIDLISKSPVLFQAERLKKITMYNDVIFQYIEKLIPVKQYLNEDLSNDPLINKIKTNEIKNKKLLEKLQKNLSIEQFLNIINYDLENFLSFLEKLDYLDEYEKQILANQVLDKLLEDTEAQAINTIMTCIAKNNQNTLWTNYITEEKIKMVQRKFINRIWLLLEADNESINHILDNETYNINFIKNLTQLLSNDNSLFFKEKDSTNLKIKLDKILEEKYMVTPDLKKVEINPNDKIETIVQKSKIYDLTGRIIDQSTALYILNQFLNNKIELTETTLKPVIRSIIVNVLKSMEVPINGACFDNCNSYNGVNISDYEVISINYNLLSQMLNKNKKLYDRLEIFYVMFHEMKHSKQNDDIRNNKLNISTYEMQKEVLLREFNEKYYGNNYQKALKEMDARVSGYEMFSKFLEIFSKDLLDKIQEQLIKDLEKEQSFQQNQVGNNQIELLGKKDIYFNQAFDSLILYNPNLLEKYPLFKLEYHLDGTPKTPEEILLEQTEENKQLINDIIAKRQQLLNLNQETIIENNKSR